MDHNLEATNVGYRVILNSSETMRCLGQEGIVRIPLLCEYGVSVENFWYIRATLSPP